MCGRVELGLKLPKHRAKFGEGLLSLNMNAPVGQSGALEDARDQLDTVSTRETFWEQ